MKKSMLLSLFFMLFASVALMAQEAEAEIEELDAPPSLDELLERPKPIKYPSFDEFVTASFNLYDKVIEVRKNGEENGWPSQGVKVSRFNKEILLLVKETAEMAKGLKDMPKLKLIPATMNFAKAKKAISHSRANIKYMKSQFSEEEWAMIVAADEAGLEDWQEVEEAAEEAEEVEEDGDGDGK